MSGVVYRSFTLAKEKFQSVRGMQDLLPEQSLTFDYITDTFRKLGIQLEFRGDATNLSPKRSRS